MKVLCLLGSPRVGGNSALLAERVLRPLRDRGARVETVHLNSLTYRGCQACRKCKTQHDHCVLDDDLTEVLEHVAAADVVVLASPVYYGDVSGQMKCFIDRTFAFLKPGYTTSTSPCRLAPGKRAAMVLTQGAPDESMFQDVFPRYKNFFDWYGFAEFHLARAVGVHEPGEVESNRAALARAEEVGRLLAG